MAFSLDGTDRPVVFAATQTTIRRIDDPATTWPFPGGGSLPTTNPVTLLPLDWNNDFRTDLLAAGAGGIRLLLQDDGGRFNDATSAASKNAPISCRCLGAWAADVEMDGDLDVVLGVAGGAAVVLRNNGDGTWTTLDTFASLRDVRGFAWADLDRDGDPDAVVLSEGAVRVLRDSGRSLLPVGVRAVHGRFERGDMVSCRDESGREVARGLVNYSAEETLRIMGSPSHRIEAILGYAGDAELIHRDNLVLV